MLSLLNRVFTGPFYSRNAGTFLVVVLLAFGFMRAIEHKALITAALGSPFLLVLVFGLWALYGLKVTAFIWQELEAPEHLFLQTFRLLPGSVRARLWLSIQIGLWLPILAYGGWMLIIAGQLQRWLPAASITICLLTLLAMGALAADYRLRRPGTDLVRLPHLAIRVPYGLFFPVYWLRHGPLSLVLTKGFSGLLLVGVCRLYPTDDYDQRLLLIGLLLSVLVHGQVGHQWRAFEQQYLLLLPNLPLSRWQRLYRYGLTYGLIWLPECLLLVRNRPAGIGLDYIGWLALTGWGWLLLLHGLAYQRTVQPERWLSGVFAGFIGGLMLIMFGWPVEGWLLVGWLGAIGIWCRSPIANIQ